MKLSDSIDKIKQQTRRYAKRQITWFKRCKNTRWIYLDDEEYSNELRNNTEIDFNKIKIIVDNILE